MKKIAQGLSDKDLQTHFNEGIWLYILKRGVCIYGGCLFLGLMLNHIFMAINRDIVIFNDTVLITLFVCIVAGLLFGYLLWREISVEYMRRFKPKDK